MIDIKHSFPLHLADYTVRNGINEEPAFAWWVKQTFKHRKSFISSVQAQYAKRTHKFGIKVPTSVEEVLKIDKDTNTTFWRDTIQKEMKNTRQAFWFLEDDETVPIGYKWIKCHLIFDVKMDFTRKARFVAGGHMTNPPQEITYSSIVSRDSVRIAFLLVALNGVDLLATDIGNAYLNALPREKIYTTASPEFGAELQGRHVLIVQALYGLKSSGAAWRAHLASTLASLGFHSCLADPDVWYHSANKADGYEYYEYVLVYVDDVLVFSHAGRCIMFALEEFYRLKDGFSKPTQYLGAMVKEWTFSDGSEPCWALSSQQYVDEAIRNIEIHLKQSNHTLCKSNQPMPTWYHPELNVTPYLQDEDINFYQSQISILCWMVELGRVDIYINVAILSSILAPPREGHLEAIYLIYGYLKSHNRSNMVFDPSYVNWRSEDFQIYSWEDFYKDASEDIPTNAPVPRGKPVQINMFVDANHAGNKLNRRSQTGVLIYLNRAPLIWYSKAQKTVETSTFGSEFVALRIATELVKALRYKLRMMGIPLEGSANVLVDNDTVVKNATIPSSTLQKKHNAICYHFVREAVAWEIIRMAFVPSSENLADMFTKMLGATKLHNFCQNILY